jgi:hypothetical protein
MARPFITGLMALVFGAVSSSCTAGSDDGQVLGPPVVTEAAEACLAGGGVGDDLVPGCGVLLGTIDPPSSAGPPIDLDHQEQTIASTMAIADDGAPGAFSFDLVRVYQRGGRGAVASLEERFAAPDDHPGRLLFFSWKIDAGTDAWSRIAGGAADETLEAFGAAVAKTGRTIFVSLHHEPEGDPEGSPADYVDMWRHAHDVIEAAIAAAQGTGRIMWVMNYMGHVDGEDLGSVDAYYPGDAYVDWLSYNPYNWAVCRPGARWRSFVDVATPLYRHLTTEERFLGADGAPKPIMIGETGTNEDPDDGTRKAEWIREMAATLEGGKLPRIKALVYFNQATPDFCDRHWDSSPASAAAFAEVATSAFFDPQDATAEAG